MRHRETTNARSIGLPGIGREDLKELSGFADVVSRLRGAPLPAPQTLAHPLEMGRKLRAKRFEALELQLFSEPPCRETSDRWRNWTNSA